MDIKKILFIAGTIAIFVSIYLTSDSYLDNNNSPHNITQHDNKNSPNLPDTSPAPISANEKSGSNPPERWSLAPEPDAQSDISIKPPETMPNESNPSLQPITQCDHCDLRCEFSKTDKNNIICFIYGCVPKDYSVRLWSDFDGYLGPLEILSDDRLENLTVIRISNKGEEYKINTMSKYLVEVTNKESSVVCSVEISRGCRIALFITGIVGALDGNKLSDDEKVVEYTADSVKRHLIRPNEDAGCKVDIFAHTWSIGMEKAIRNNFNPWLVSFKNQSYIGKGKQITSIEETIKLRKEYEINNTITYNWVFIQRYDMIYYENITMTTMNLDLVYIAHWCKAQTNIDVFNPTPDQYKCRAVNGPFWPEPKRGVPDFYFGGTPENIDTVFVNMWADTEQRKYIPGECPELHSYYGGRLYNLHDNNKIKLGRYRYHAMDYDVLRSYLSYPGRNVYKSGFMFWWNNTVSIDQNERPFLKKSYPYWDTAINFNLDHRIPRRDSFCGESTNMFYLCFTKEMETRLPGAWGPH